MPAIVALVALLTRYSVPPLSVVEQETTVSGGKEMTHLIVKAGYNPTHPSSFWVDLKLPGHISNSPYPDDDHDHIVANQDYSILAVNLQTGDKSAPLRICVFQSTPTKIRVIPDFAEKVAAAMRLERASNLFYRSEELHWAHFHGSEEMHGTSKEWRDFVDGDLRKWLRVDGIGGRVDGERVGNDVLGLRSQPEEVNHAFLQVRLTRAGGIVLKSLWHEGE